MTISDAWLKANHGKVRASCDGFGVGVTPKAKIILQPRFRYHGTAKRLDLGTYPITMLASVVCGCSGSTIRVEILEPAFREKYLEVLNKSAIEYTSGSDGVISVKAKNLDDLENRMKEYTDWEMQERKKEH